MDHMIKEETNITEGGESGEVLIVKQWIIGYEVRLLRFRSLPGVCVGVCGCVCVILASFHLSALPHLNNGSHITNLLGQCRELA